MPGTKTKMKSAQGIVFPILLRFHIVAKFLCQMGSRNEQLIDFDKEHRFFLEREPKN